MFRRFQLFRGEECERIAAAVHALRRDWVQRHDLAPFFTLGAASYLDAAEPALRSRYYERARRDNALLNAHLDWMYEKLAATLSDELGAPCAYDDRLARPGFHVFLPHEVFEEPVASIHVDLQYRLIDWSGHAKPDFVHPISFTASVLLPRGGAGLNTWDIPHEQALRASREEVEQMAAANPPEFHAYTRGGLVIHSGHTVHQIAPTPRTVSDDPDDARITLQGHAVCSERVWWIYW